MNDTYSPEEHPSLDLNTITEIKSLFEDGLYEFLDDFKKSSTGLTEIILIATAENDTISIINASHTLKGISSQIGGLKLSEICQTLEESLMNGTEINIDHFSTMIQAEVKELLNQIDIFKASA